VDECKPLGGTLLHFSPRVSTLCRVRWVSWVASTTQSAHVKPNSGGVNGRGIRQHVAGVGGPAQGGGGGRQRGDVRQGLTLVHFSAQLEDLQETSLALELYLSTFGTRPGDNVGYMGDKVSST